MTVDAWNAVADAFATLQDEPAADHLAHALRRMGLTDEEREALHTSIAGRQDAAGTVLLELVEGATPSSGDRAQAWQPWAPADMDKAIAVAAEVTADPAAIDTAGMADRVDSLRALPPDQAGDLVVALVVTGLQQADPAARAAALRAALKVSQLAPMTRLRVADLLATAGTLEPEERAQLAEILINTPRERVLRGVATALREAPSSPLAELVTALGEAGRSDWAMAEPPSSFPPEAAPAPAGAAPEGEEPVYRGGTTPGTTAYSRIDLTTGTDRPDVVVVDQPFTATVGLGPRPSYGVVSTGAIATSGEVIDVVLVYDPDSLTPQGPTRHQIQPTADTPHPSVEVTFTASYLESAPATRRLGVQYLVGGQVVGLAWRSFVAVDEPALVASAPAPSVRERDLLDLSPLLVEEAPDLVVAVVASDSGKDRWVWTVYAADPALPTPDAPNASTLDGEVADFALATRRAIQFSSDKLNDYFTLAGRAKRIGASMPASVQTALSALIAQPGRTEAPSVLLLTEELVIPWELAALDPPVTTPWGGDSVFLGAHVALGRWPLSEHRPRPVPRSQVQVRSAAVVTADYTGVPGWGRLEFAATEAVEVGGLFSPPAAQVAAELPAVVDLLRGTPPADIIHVALHGQYDNAGDQEGIVLVRRDGTTAAASFLTPLQVENGNLEGGPFVFLNACQVGTDERVLGSYGGFASTLLRIGAGGVVAALWNIDDDVAAAVARQMYAQTLGPETVPVAEAMRRIRAAYTETAVEQAAPGVSATLVAFQMFGHPRLRLTRAEAAPGAPASTERAPD